MATRRSSSSSSSSSSSATELGSSRIRQQSETSRDTLPTTSQHRERSPTNTIDGTSIAETTTIRSASPTTSHASVPPPAVNRVNQQIPLAPPQNAGGVPIIRPPGLQGTGGTGIGVFGPQYPQGYPTQPPTNAIKIDVAAAQQQYQQRTAVGDQQASSYSGTSSSSAGSLTSPGSVTTQRPQGPAVPQPQQRPNPANTSSINVDQSRQWAQGGGANRGAGPNQQQQQQQQQAQFANQIPPEHIYNELLGPDAFKDVILDIDYGALGSFNVPFQSAEHFSGEQLPPGINIRPAYTSVDSLSYQQHMFNTARTIYADGGSSGYDYSGASNQNYNYQDVAAQPHFDAAKAIFNQVDANHDGSITRDEFRQWAQPGTGQNNQFNRSTVLDGGNPAVAQILQQSGLGQVLRP